MIAKYSKIFPYAPYLNETIGFEKNIPDDSTEKEMLETISELNRIATISFYERYPQCKPKETPPVQSSFVEDIHTEPTVLPIIQVREEVKEKKTLDAVTKKIYFNAMAKGDFKRVEEIESNYIVPKVK